MPKERARAPKVRTAKGAAPQRSRALFAARIQQRPAQGNDRNRFTFYVKDYGVLSTWSVLPSSGLLQCFLRRKSTPHRPEGSLAVIDSIVLPKTRRFQQVTESFYFRVWQVSFSGTSPGVLSICESERHPIVKREAKST